MELKNGVIERVTSMREKLIALSRDIHAHPETAFEETYTSERVRQELSSAGFKIETLDDYPTAFIARFGNGRLKVGICAELDALPNIGHACGHNIIAASAVGAAIALRDIADQLDISIVVLGTPGEERLGGKIFMLQKGSFDGLHAAMMVHPYALERTAMGSLAVAHCDVSFTGKAAHAAARPELGRNAASAMALAQAGIGMLREHIGEGTRIHGIVVDGGDAPNIVPDHTKGQWYVRARNVAELVELLPRVRNVFFGAAMMTECSVTFENTAPIYCEIKTDEQMASIWANNMMSVGRESIPPTPADGFASTDMGNVSYAVPSIHPTIAIDAGGANIHEAAFVDASINESADEAVCVGATCMANTIVDMAQDISVRERLLKAEFKSADHENEPFMGFNYAVAHTYP